MKSKKIIMYQIKKGGSFTLCATDGMKSNRFIQMSMDKYGKALGKNVTDAELGKAVRDMFLISK